MIFFRVDANEKIATGHVMRCITVADALKDLGERCVFITADDNAKELIAGNGFDRICLGSKWDDLESELPKLFEVISANGEGSDVIVVDSYATTPRYLAELAGKIKTVYFDDMFADRYDVDMIINYNLYYSRFPYDETYKNSRTKMLLGGRFVPLRRQFYDHGSDVDPEAGNEVLLMCGGGDRYGILPDIAKALLDSDSPALKDLTFNIVAGGFSHVKDELERLAKESGRINIYQNVTDMAGLMSRCRAAISAAGTVLYELCALNIPTVFFCMADNQEYDRDVFGKGLMCYAGDIRQDRDGEIRGVTEGLEDLISNTQKADDMKLAMADVIDGRGALRIAEEIRALAHN